MRGRRRKYAGYLAAVVGLVLAGSLLGAACASAASFGFKEYFGAVSGHEPSVVAPWSLTVDPSNGDLLVVDQAAKTISRFKPNGEPDPFTALSSNVIDGLSGPDETPAPHGLSVGGPAETEVAVDASCVLHSPPLTGLSCSSVDPANGDIYITQAARHQAFVFGEDGTFLRALTASSEGEFGEICGVTVGSGGSVYLGDFGEVGAPPLPNEGRIHGFSPTSNAPYEVTNTENFSYHHACTLAAGSGVSAGSLFADMFNGGLAKVDTSVTPWAIPSGCEGIASENVSIATNTANGHVVGATKFKVKELGGGCTAQPEPALAEFAIRGGDEVSGVAVDGANGLIYSSNRQTGKIEVWKELGVLPEVATKPAVPVGVETATLNGTVNPMGRAVTQCFFEVDEHAPEYGLTVPCSEYEEAGAWHRLLSLAELGSGSAPVPVRAEIGELHGGTTYNFQLRAANAGNVVGETVAGGNLTLLTLGPRVSNESADQISGSGGRVGAEIDPHGVPTSVFVEYLDEAEYLANAPGDRFAGAARAPLPARQIPGMVSGSGNLEAGSKVIKDVTTSAGSFAAGQAISGSGIPGGTVVLAALSPTELQLSQSATATAKAVALTATGPQPVFEQLTGLQELTAYHFRFVADNGQMTRGADTSFTTFPPAGPPLPDKRAYEMVSPPHKRGEVIPPEPSALLSGACSECLPGANQWTMPMQAIQSKPEDSVLFSGQPFGSGLASNVNEYVYGRGPTEWSGQSLSGPAMSGRWEGFSPDLSRGVLWQEDPALSPLAPTRGRHAFAELYLRDASGGLTPLITSEPPDRGAGGLNPNRLIVRYAAANEGPPASFDHVVFEANDALTGAVPGVAPAAPEVTEMNQECSVGNCDLYEWSENSLHLVNVLPGNSVAAKGAVIGSGHLLANAVFEYESANVTNAISADGDKIFWSSGETGHVYARVNRKATFEVRGPATCKESEPLASRSCFLTASSDGSKVLLSNGEIYKLDEGAEAYIHATDLTNSGAGIHQGGFQGILGVAPDLSRVYFVDTAVLSGENVEGHSPRAGDDNLYLWEETTPGEGGIATFIGTLLPEDDQFSINGRLGAWKANPASRTAQTTSEGGYLAFMSKSALTGYDNRVSGGGECAPRVTGGEACFEVFEYSATTHRLTCASCNPTGQRPLGQSNLSLLRSLGFEPSHPQPGNLSREGGGRLFFESQDALSGQDSNGRVQDVYEWEPLGASCGKANGCISLISTGHAAGESWFVDSTPSGNNAFFITRQPLLPRDQDEQLDLYDARVGGGFGEEVESSCTGEACRGPLVEAPAQPSGGTQSFVGPGNPKSGKGPHKKKNHRHKRAHHKKHKRAAKSHQGGRK